MESKRCVQKNYLIIIATYITGLYMYINLLNKKKAPVIYRNLPNKFGITYFMERTENFIGFHMKCGCKLSFTYAYVLVFLVRFVENRRL